jgi:hypothetical protein
VSTESKALTGSNAHIRVLAGIEYATNPDGPSIEQLHRDPRFAQVSVRTLERWSVEDNWTDRRREFVEKWTEYARAQLGTRIAQKRIEDLSLLESLRQDALDKLVDPEEELRPKSWDSVVQVISKLTEQLDGIRRQIGGEMLSTIGQPVLPTADDEHPEFARDDIEVAARQLLLQRQLGTGTPIPAEAVIETGEVLDSEEEAEEESTDAVDVEPESESAREDAI